MFHRFFTTESLATNDIVLGDEAQVHQLIRVLRMEKGDVFILNEGNGEDVEVEITLATKKEIHAKVLARTAVWVPRVQVEICLATIRKERFEWALEKCTELGVSQITPLHTERAERGVVPHARAERIIKEASEQCGRGNIPTYGDAVDIEKCISTAVNSGRIVFVCVHSGTPYPQILGSRFSALDSCVVLIGPEGGWSPKELALFKKYSVTEVSLGPTNLRAETAAVTASALILSQVN